MTLIEAARWLLLLPAVPVLVGSGAANWAVLVAYISKRKLGSMSPLIGGVGAAVAFALSPATWIRDSWWIPLVVDPGCAIWLAVVVLWALRGRAANKRNRSVGR